MLILIYSDAYKVGLDKLHELSKEFSTRSAYCSAKLPIKLTRLGIDLDNPIYRQFKSLCEVDIGMSNIITLTYPEHTLSASNQIKLAQLLLSMCNSGLDLLVLTTSDYIVTEFNILHMTRNIKFGHAVWDFYNGRWELSELNESGYKVRSLYDAMSEQGNRLNEILWSD